MSADYVTLSTEYIHAESKAEEEARLAREEAERQAAARAAEEARRAREAEEAAKRKKEQAVWQEGNLRKASRCLPVCGIRERRHGKNDSAPSGHVSITGSR